jgi:trk system potassium uptake protein TrkH
VFIVFAGMFIGGASGATVGGIKMIRALIIGKGIRWQVNKAFMSHDTIKTIRFDGKSLLPDQMNAALANAAVFAFLFLLFILAGTFVTYFFMPDGLSTGITAPDMHPAIEATYIFQMWIGRLEIIPVIALFRALMMGTGYRKI